MQLDSEASRADERPPSPHARHFGPADGASCQTCDLRDAWVRCCVSTANMRSDDETRWTATDTCLYGPKDGTECWYCAGMCSCMASFGWYLACHSSWANTIVASTCMRTCCWDSRGSAIGCWLPLPGLDRTIALGMRRDRGQLSRG
jgi:hypothetical protein